MYTLKKLPFSFYELEPFIDTHTIGLHYYKHQASYLTNLNKLLENYNLNYPIEDLYNHLDKIKEEDKNDVNVYIGKETKLDDDVTIIKTKYKLDGEEGTIAIIGPKRMEYNRVVNMLEFVKENLEER